mmetsp:Transcript_22104/g.61669  ORF Transcript_22104/g.61669 Transcript_22104/m.61669 type:complete len:252 (-) Transcript_22104:1082-1837(-)
MGRSSMLSICRSPLPELVPRAGVSRSEQPRDSHIEAPRQSAWTRARAAGTRRRFLPVNRLARSASQRSASLHVAQHCASPRRRLLGSRFAKWRCVHTCISTGPGFGRRFASLLSGRSPTSPSRGSVLPSGNLSRIPCLRSCSTPSSPCRTTSRLPSRRAMPTPVSHSSGAPLPPPVRPRRMLARSIVRPPPVGRVRGRQLALQGARVHSPSRRRPSTLRWWTVMIIDLSREIRMWGSWVSLLARAHQTNHC